MINGLYFVRFSNLIPVKGYTNSIICDLQRSTYYCIDELAYEIVSTLNRSSLSEIHQALGQQYDTEKIDYYLEELISEEIIFMTANPESFPELSLEWDEPYNFTNAIIDIRGKIHNNEELSRFFQEVRIHTIQLRFFDVFPLKEINSMLNLVLSWHVEVVEIVLPFQDMDPDFESEVVSIVASYNQVSLICVYNAKEDKQIHLGASNLGRIFFSIASVEGRSCCGKVSMNSFIVNFKMFTESQEYNSCLNRKISIDEEGFIRNCPSMTEHFGHISNASISELLGRYDIEKNWKINKNLVHICKDCEYRYICVDCRAYLEDTDNILSKPLKCGYNPYSGNWEDWREQPGKKVLLEKYKTLHG